MKVKYKKSGMITEANRFNTSTCSEVLTGDDSVFIIDLDVYLDSKLKWVDMGEAFKNKDLITDNYNTRFFEPKNEEDKQRGFSLD